MSPLALHFADFHGGITAGIKVKGIYTLNLPPRRGDFDTILLQKEKMWIFRLKTLVPLGLNTECSFQPFLGSIEIGLASIPNTRL